MRYLKSFNESFSSDKWPQKNGKSDFFFPYSSDISQLESYLDNWFKGGFVDEELSKNSFNKRNTHRYFDEIITLKKFDDKTTRSLFNKTFNPISLTIHTSLRGDLYSLSAKIHSVNDNHYHHTWENSSLDKLKNIRDDIKEWISQKDEINGKEFLDYCKS